MIFIIKMGKWLIYYFGSQPYVLGGIKSIWRTLFYLHKKGLSYKKEVRKLFKKSVYELTKEVPQHKIFDTSNSYSFFSHFSSELLLSFIFGNEIYFNHSPKKMFQVKHMFGL